MILSSLFIILLHSVFGNGLKLVHEFQVSLSKYQSEQLSISLMLCSAVYLKGICVLRILGKHESSVNTVYFTGFTFVVIIKNWITGGGLAHKDSLNDSFASSFRHITCHQTLSNWKNTITKPLQTTVCTDTTSPWRLISHLQILSLS